MSMLTYIASDAVLKEAAVREEPDFSHELWDDGFCIVPLEGAVDDVWTEKKYTAALEWDYSEQRARYVIDYLREVLERTDEAEVWHIWMGFGENPTSAHRKTGNNTTWNKYTTSCSGKKENRPGRSKDMKRGYGYEYGLLPAFLRQYG